MSSDCSKCKAHEAAPGAKLCQRCLDYNRESSRRGRAKAKESGTCTRCLKRPNNGYYFCRQCREDIRGHGDRQVSGETQDLSAYPNFARGDRGGLRYASTWLPKPTWTKHTRTALTAKPGFRPLVTSAKKYEQFLAQAVLVNDLIGWIRPGTEYILEVISFVHKSDMDQWSGGILDGLVKAGLLPDDKQGEALVSRRRIVPKTEEQRIFIAVYETEKGSTDGSQE